MIHQLSTINAIILGTALGLAGGVGGFTFLYAKGASYLTNNPEACANCHIMQEQYDGWVKSSHHLSATCNDCHTPHALIPKYATKAANGFWHSLHFTLGGFHEPIQIKERNRRITEDSCRRCHQEIVAAIEAPSKSIAAQLNHAETPQLPCLQCHRSAGHLH